VFKEENILNCPNCGIEDIEVQVQVSLIAKLKEIMDWGRLFNIKDDIDYMWCHSCHQGLKLTEDGKLVTFLRYPKVAVRTSKTISKDALIEALKAMSSEDRAKLLGKEV
jgi:hypothetical protein